MLLGGVVGFGTLGFELIEGWGLWESFYFTIVTISTVGYGDYGLSKPGQMFASLVMLVGIGSLTYTLGQVMQAAVETGLDKERRMHRQIGSLQNHVIVCGIGRFGAIVCEQLDEAGAAFVAIDLNPDTVESFRKRGWIVIEGDAADDDVLVSAGIHHARALVSVSSRDSDNIVVTLSAHSLVPELEITSRAEHTDSVRKIRRAGATHVISPALIGGRQIAESILNPALSRLMNPLEIQPESVRLFEIGIEEGSPLVGRTLQEVGREHADLVFVTMTPSDTPEQVRPEVDARFAAGQTHVIAANPRTIEPFLQSVSRHAA